MAGPLLGIGDDRREALVQPAAPLGSRGAVDRRGQQRMCEAKAARLGYEHAGLLGLEQAGAGVVLGSDGPEDQLARGPGQRRRHEAREPTARPTTRPRARARSRAGLSARAAGLPPRRRSSRARARGRSRARGTGFLPTPRRVARVPGVAEQSPGGPGSGGGARRARVAPARAAPADAPARPARDPAAPAPRDRPGG